MIFDFLTYVFVKIRQNNTPPKSIWGGPRAKVPPLSGNLPKKHVLLHLRMQAMHPCMPQGCHCACAICGHILVQCWGIGAWWFGPGCAILLLVGSVVCSQKNSCLAPLQQTNQVWQKKNRKRKKMGVKIGFLYLMPWAPNVHLHPKLHPL